MVGSVDRQPQAPSLFGAAIAFLAAVACWALLSLGLTEGLNLERPFAAAAIYGGNATTQIRIARVRNALTQTADNFSTPDPAAAPQTRARALAALRADPLSVDAFEQLGRGAEEADDVSLAMRYFTETYRRSFREGDATARLLQAAFDDRQWDAAIAYSDAILRERPSMTRTLTPLLAVVADQPDARKTLAATLALGPVWRSRFLAEYGATIGKSEVFEDLISLLKASPRPMTTAEVGPYLDKLLTDGSVDEALTIWLAFQPDNSAGAVPLLVNGDFTAPVNDLPFNWKVSNAENARVSIVDAVTGAEGKAVEAEFLNGRGPFANVSQVLALTPGRYRLRGKVRTDEFRNARGMYWRLYCGARGREAPIAETERIRDEPGGWRPFSVAFDVPRQRCAAQLLRLELAARIPPEQLASGAIWFAEIAIERVQ